MMRVGFLIADATTLNNSNTARGARRGSLLTHTRVGAPVLLCAFIHPTAGKYEILGSPDAGSCIALPRSGGAALLPAGNSPQNRGSKSTQMQYGGSVALGYDLVSALIALPGWKGG